MAGFFSRLKGKDGPTKIKSKKLAAAKAVSQQPAVPRWEDAYARKNVEPEEIRDLVHACTEELKARALDIPFLLLPFRPTSDPSAVRTFVRHFFDPDANLTGELLAQELRMTEPMVISGVIKWCWSRLQGGVVGWDAYELFKMGEQDSNGARDAFNTFIPLSVDNTARSSIINDFFDLMSAIAAHGKANGFGGRKLSRMASWWAFESLDSENTFEGGYKVWLKAADATSHLFFAYLRSRSPQQNFGSFATLPISLQKLLQETEYPPQRPLLLQSSTHKVVMIVDAVSPTPFALLRRGSHFQYRDEDRALREFSDYDDPLQALTDECRRVLKAISAANQTQAVSSSKHSTSLRDASWSRFEDIGFGSLLEEDEDEDESAANMANRRNRSLRTTPASGGLGLARPTTPSWADFLSSGFVDDDSHNTMNALLPPDKVLPPIDTTIRQRSSQSHRPRLETEHILEPGELASISRLDLDDAFWWVWMSSLAPEETPERKSAFGRCAVIETRIRTGRWIVMEEIVKGAAAEPDPGAYIAEKKSFFSWTRRNKSVTRSKSTGKRALDRSHTQGGLLAPPSAMGSSSKASIATDQQARIHAAAQRLQERQKQEQAQREDERVTNSTASKRGRLESSVNEKTTSVFTLQPVIVSEASPALKWASKYDKETIREAYLSNTNAGRGGQASMSTPAVHLNGMSSTTATNGTSAYDKAADAAHKPTPPAPQPVVVPPSRKPVQPLISPAPRTDNLLSEKAIEAPASLHPAERPSDPSGPKSPVVPPKDTPTASAPAAAAAAPTPLALDSSPESKKPTKKLHKEVKDIKEKEKAAVVVEKTKEKEKEKVVASTATAPPPTSGPLRKLFNRKNRQSKLPENAGMDVNAMLAAAAAESSASAPAPPPEFTAAVTAPKAPKAPEPVAEKPVSAPTAPAVAPVAPVASAPKDAQRPRTPPMAEPTYDASVNSLSRVGTADAHEADQEFARFDQGPLDQPAFVPEDSDGDDDDAVPPPIARQRSPVRSPVLPNYIPPPIDEAKPVPVQDRWAQIRKNAAERAAQRQVDDPSRPIRAADADDDTSGEETIESRVARIKARVAELTGNMEGVTGPGSRAAPLRRP